MLQLIPSQRRLLPRLRVLSAVLCVVLSSNTGQTADSIQEEVFDPAALYAPQLEGEKPSKNAPKLNLPDVDFSGSVTTVADNGPVPITIPLQPGKAVEQIAAWATESTAGPLGRPLPLAGSWNVEAYGPETFVRLIKEGHHVILNFQDPSSEAMREYLALPEQKEKAKERLQNVFDTYYKPGLEFAREHSLPISMRGWNWAYSPRDFQQKKARRDKVEIPADQWAALLRDGEPVGPNVDPFGPDEPWVEWGKFWFGNDLLKMIQEVYPNPPLVIWLNNNESGEPHVAEIVKGTDRLKAKYGDGPYEDRFLDRTVREAFDAKYKKMFEAAKASLVSPAWRENSRLVAYNTLWSAVSIGSKNLPRPGYNFENETGWQHWRRYDGDMTEFYSNDWQPGKAETRPFGMQGEAINFESIQDWILQQNPNYFLTHIFWEGAVPGEVFRGRRSVSKPFTHIMRGQRWSTETYEGWVQFCLWVTRPRLAFEFRAAEPLDAIRKLIWNGLLDSVDRPWNSSLLEEFWRKGKLVQNPAERPFHDDLRPDAPEWLKSLERWSLLSTDANPPRSTWEEKTTQLRVFAVARVLGEKPDRRWLVYAHAPYSARSNVRVMIPEYGLIQLPSVPQSGSFFLLEESSKSLTTVLAGGPSEIRVEAKTEQKWIEPGTSIEIAVAGVHSPNQAIKSYTWDFGDGTKPQEATTPAAVSHTFEKPGIYLAGVTATTDTGETLSDRVAIFVGKQPSEDIVYDLALNSAIPFKGPWSGAGEDGQTLVTYQHIPNNSSFPQPGIAAGLKLVDDPEKGNVMEFDGDDSGLWLARTPKTVMTGREGAANRTVSFWFKADSVEGRQVLYASGIGTVGSNVYLDNGTIYAGSWATVDGKYEADPPVFGYNWKGDWITYLGIEPGKWYQVTWVLKDGVDSVQPDRQTLFVNGKKIGSAPGAAIPVEYMPPRFGRSRDNETPGILTRFHDSDEMEKLRPRDRVQILNFKGRMSEAKFLNAAKEP